MALIAGLQSQTTQMLRRVILCSTPAGLTNITDKVRTALQKLQDNIAAESDLPAILKKPGVEEIRYIERESEVE